jgi:hypothetical protein
MGNFESIFDLAMSLVRRQPDKQNRDRGNLAAYELCPSNMAFLVRPRITSIFFESLRGCISLGPSGGILPPSGIGRKLSHIHSALSFGIRATELHTSCAQTDRHRTCRPSCCCSSSFAWWQGRHAPTDAPSGAMTEGGRLLGSRGESGLRRSTKQR